MQVNPHYELYRMSRTQVNEVYLNGSGTQNQSPYQSEAMENVYYWYDGNVPYCTDATAWQPLDDNFVHMNVPGYFYVDNSGVTHQLVNIRHNSHVGFQESVPHSCPPQYWEPPCPNAHNRTPVFSNPASPCTSVTSPCASLSSVAWSDSVPSPTSHSRCHSHSDNAVRDSELQLNLAPYPEHPGPSVSPAHSLTRHSPSHGRQQSDDAINESQLQLVLPPPSVPQMVSPVDAHSPQQPQQQQKDHDQSPPEALTPTTPPSGPSSPALISMPPQDPVGRRTPAPKRRRITRAVQPLACYFCRGRKIACGPPTNPGSGDRTCEPCARRHLVCEYPAESYRGRRSGPKAGASVRPQQR